MNREAPGPLRDDEYEALANFRYGLRRFLHFSEEAARAAGVTPQQHQVLLAVKGWRRGPVTVGDLAERLLLKPHSVSGLIDRLAAAGLIRRAGAADDHRLTVVELTPKAEALLAGLSRAHRDELRRLGPLLSTLLAQIGQGA